jgi:hypothetical protein
MNLVRYFFGLVAELARPSNGYWYVGLSWSANYFRYFDQVLTTVIGSRKIPGRKIRPVNWYSIFLPPHFSALVGGV